MALVRYVSALFNAFVQMMPFALVQTKMVDMLHLSIPFPNHPSTLVEVQLGSAIVEHACRAYLGKYEHCEHTSI